MWVYFMEHAQKAFEQVRNLGMAPQAMIAFPTALSKAAVAFASARGWGAMLSTMFLGALGLGSFALSALAGKVMGTPEMAGASAASTATDPSMRGSALKGLAAGPAAMSSAASFGHSGMMGSDLLNMTKGLASAQRTAGATGGYGAAGARLGGVDSQNALMGIGKGDMNSAIAREFGLTEQELGNRMAGGSASMSGSMLGVDGKITATMGPDGKTMATFTGVASGDQLRNAAKGMTGDARNQAMKIADAGGAATITGTMGADGQWSEFQVKQSQTASSTNTGTDEARSIKNHQDTDATGSRTTGGDSSNFDDTHKAAATTTDDAAGRAWAEKHGVTEGARNLFGAGNYTAEGNVVTCKNGNLTTTYDKGTDITTISGVKDIGDGQQAKVEGSYKDGQMQQMKMEYTDDKGMKTVSTVNSMGEGYVQKIHGGETKDVDTYTLSEGYNLDVSAAGFTKHANETFADHGENNEGEMRAMGTVKRTAEVVDTIASAFLKVGAVRKALKPEAQEVVNPSGKLETNPELENTRAQYMNDRAASTPYVETPATPSLPPPPTPYN